MSEYGRIEPRDSFNESLVRNVHPPDWVNPEPAERYNMVVLGGGTAGLVTAAGAAGLGAKAALVERHLIGGDCLNVGCVPSKCLIRSSRAMADIRDAGQFGVRAPGGAEVDFPAVMERMRRLRSAISDHDSADRFRSLGVDVFLGEAAFAGRDTVEVGGKTLRFSKACIATGARAVCPPIDGLADAGFLTNETVFSLTERPRRLAVLGAGPLGCELAQAFHRLGSQVTLIEMNAQLLAREDPDAAAIIAEAFRREGIDVRLNTKVKRVTRVGGEKRILADVDGQEVAIPVDEILVGAGRQPNVDGLGLDVAGVDYDPRRGVVVADNGSTDRTAVIAVEHGARVVPASRRGYGSACLAGIAALAEPDIVVFLDGDFSDHPEEMPLLVDPIASGEADMVLGSRVLGCCEPGALTPQARFGNWLTCSLLRLFWRVRQTDLGPFRAITFRALRSLRMRDPDYGWTVEMQIKAALRGLRVREVPVSYRRRIGASKISGTVRGVVGAGVTILGTVFRAALDTRRFQGGPPRQRLIIFSRLPQPGKAKTRLIPVLGPEGAAALQRQMTERLVGQARHLAERVPTEIEVRFTDGAEEPMREWLGADLAYRPQCEGDLGRRMADAFAAAFEAEVDAAVIVGADVPSLTADIMAGAFNALHRHDLVLGPATDGGYYLVGLRRPAPELFDGIPWSTADVLQRTLDVAESRGISVALTPPLHDVDRPGDLALLEQSQATTPGRLDSSMISIIVPTLDEAVHIGNTLDRAREGTNTELIVVDGGSADGTVDLAGACGARVIVHPPGRARQMNAAAAEAEGDILLFVHADTLLPEGFDGHIRRTLSAPGVAAGAFEFRVDSHPRGMKLIERMTNWRSKKLQMPYGDQTLFIEAGTFHRVGGFPELPLMEDFELVRRLKRQGRVVTAPAPAISSARRWRQRGTLRATLLNQVIIAAYFLGVSPARLARWYYGKREGEGGAPSTGRRPEK